MKEDMYLILKKGGFTSGTHKKTYSFLDLTLGVHGKNFVHEPITC